MVRTKQNFAPKTVPLPHQVEAIEYLANHSAVALFDEQGLGKTKIVIDALSRGMQLGEIDGVLVVAPLTLVYLWEAEVEKHSHLVPMVLRGGRREKKYRFLSGANFYLTNYEAVVAELQRMKRFCASRRTAVVLDESARIKDPETRAARALFELSPIAAKRIVLTGTPVANKPCDLWSQFYFLDHGALLGDDYSAFAAEYDERRPGFTSKLATLRDTVARNAVRRTKKDVLQLPEKEFRTVSVTLRGRQLELYNAVRDELRLEVTGMDGKLISEEIENILEKMLRLTQIASNPYLVNREYAELPAKFPLLQDITNSCVGRGEKVVVWSSFVDNIRALKVLLRNLSPLVIHGGIPSRDRVAVVDRFQELDGHQVLIANPAAAREGLTLTRANNAVYLDRSFNLVDYLQSQDRIHRISQTRPCTIYKMVAGGTIDEYTDLIMDLKEDVARFVQGDKDDLASTSLAALANKAQLLRILGG